MGCTASLEENEQIVVRSVGGKLSTKEGPGFRCHFTQSVVARRDAVVLEQRQYVLVQDSLTGTRRIINGPTSEPVFLGPHERTAGPQSKPTLGAGEYCRVRNVQSGDVRVVQGPAVVDIEVDDDVEGARKNEVLGRGSYAVVKDMRSGALRVVEGPRLVELEYYEEVNAKGRLPVLEVGEYCIVKDTATGEKRITCGPAVVSMGPRDEVVRQEAFPVLQEAEYCKIRDQESGVTRVVYGPGIASMGPHDVVCKKVSKLPVLQKDEYVKIVDEQEGQVRVEYGPQVVKLGTYDRVMDKIMKCIDLAADEYLVVRNEVDGAIRNVEGPLLFQPGPFDNYSGAQKVVNMRRNEYIRLRNARGEVRVIRGERRLIPDPMEELLDEGVQQAVNVDNHHAVLVRNSDSGTLELVTEHGLFFPTKYQEIVQVQEKIVLEKYQTVVCKDARGEFYYACGDTDLPESERGPGPDFFLPPHHEILKHSWSTDLEKQHLTSEDVWIFDSRPSYMNYEFHCRTLDNVVLTVDVTFFWRIIDVRSMVESTADAPGDTCTHARSMILQEISRIKLMDFLESFNETIRGACLSDSFYGKRGIELLSVEVLKFECQSEETNRILQEMIKETCDRLKFKERQRGENEVALARLDGEIEEEKRKQELVEVRKGHLKTEARIEGEAEGARISAFLSKLAACETEKGVLGLDKALQIYNMNQAHEHQLKSTAALSSGQAQLYLLPQDVNLNLGTLHNPTTTAADTTPTRAALPNRS